MKLFNCLSTKTLFVVLMIMLCSCNKVSSLLNKNSASFSTENNNVASLSNSNVSSNKGKMNNKMTSKMLTKLRNKATSKSMTSSLSEMEAFIFMKSKMESASKNTHAMKSKAKKEGNQLDVLNFINLLGKKHVSRTTLSRHKFKQAPPSEAEKKSPYSGKPAPGAGPAGAATNGSATNGTKFEDWWTFSSHDLFDTSKYPPLKLRNGEVAAIETNQYKLRINQAFNCTEDGDKKPVNNFEFWFRMDALDIYYAATKTDINILGHLDWETVIDFSETIKNFNKTTYFCININDRNNRNWVICNKSISVRNKWACEIQKILKIKVKMTCEGMKDTNENDYHTEEEIVKIQPEVIIPLPSRQCNENWSYKENGKDWECICAEGVEQSPIDLPPLTNVIDSPVKPLFEYREVGPKADFSTLDHFMVGGESLTMRNDGNYLALYNYNFGKIVTLDGVVYKAEEITFHTPSNHRIDGKQFPLEVSIIHYGQTKGDIAKQVILNFVFEKKAGVYNSFLDDIEFFNLPNSVSKVKKLDSSVYIPKILYETHGDDADNITFMKPFSFYTYQGSLPFPPCTERTVNYVNSEPLRIGSTALKLFQEALRMPDIIDRQNNSFNVIISDKVPQSNREVQPTNGRPIFHYDHSKYCPLKPAQPKIKPFGHYEKMKRDVTNYFYVNGNKPSGIPGAYVVPNEEAGHPEEDEEEDHDNQDHDHQQENH